MHHTLKNMNAKKENIVAILLNQTFAFCLILVSLMNVILKIIIKLFYQRTHYQIEIMLWCTLTNYEIKSK